MSASDATPGTPHAGTGGPGRIEALLAQLVRIDSVNPALDPAHAGEAAAARFVRD